MTLMTNHRKIQKKETMLVSFRNFIELLSCPLMHQIKDV